MKGRALTYSKAELVWLKERADLSRRELHAEFCAAFGRDDISFENLRALMKRKGWHTGRTGRFEKGRVPVNKGKTGCCAPGSEKGWFQTGERRGVAARLYKPVGTERLSKNGYVKRKIHDGLPLQSRWRAVHLIRWEEINGPVPKGHCLKCLDGDKANTDPSNWLAIPRALLPRLNGRWCTLSYDDAEPELKPYILAVAKLQHAARKALKERRP
ncbi:MAG: HNH endonuclease [Rhodobacterales bacterium]|nr:MAG: HNH endonuclease [Rhodobacterales bacterium]